jgi:alpha-mannosidase
MAQFVFHLIPNAHLDPVWLWDWREGLNEGLVTCRTILDLMDEDRDLTFIRGEVAIYEHIERTDPQTFARIRKYVKAGRWDPVGGTYIQPDTNLPDVETFARHFMRGQRYLESRFGRRARVAWAADSFGHSAGLPEVLAASGIESFAFSRPQRDIVPIDKKAFWWEGAGGSRVLAYRPSPGWYGAERHEVPERFDAYLKDAYAEGIETVGCFIGMGNHGGGPTCRQVADVRAWAAKHPEVKLVWSGLHRFFDALRKEIGKRRDIPVHRGELNFVLRGCYSSVAKFKFAYRRTENALQRAERTDAIIRAVVAPPAPAPWDRKAHRRGDQTAHLDRAWDAVLFNSFHDILPGSSIERAFDEQLAWIGGAQHAAQQVEFDALNALASHIETRVDQPEGDLPSGVAMMVWNPHPYGYRGPIELEASLDYRPIWKYHKHPEALPVYVKGPDGRAVDFQVVSTEHHAMVELAWRKRVVVEANLPSFGWNVIEIGYRAGEGDGGGDPLPPSDATMAGGEAARAGAGANAPVDASAGDHEISNGIYTVRAAIGSRGIEILRNGQPLFAAPGLGARTVLDPWGSWGGMAEEKDSIHLENVLHEWTITKIQVLERGPIRSAIWVRMEGGNSRLDLTLSCARDRAVVDIAARVFWNERSARLKLILPAGDRAEFQVPGAAVRREPGIGEVPGGKWVRVSGPGGELGFASDGLYNFDCSGGEFRATICRASRYADDVHTPAEAEPWRAAVDAGELRFNCLLTHDVQRLPRLARELEQPPVAILVPPHKGKFRRAGSLASLEPEGVMILALKPAAEGKGLILRVQETSGAAAKPKLKLMGKRVALPKVGAWQIATWRLTRSARGWTATATDVTER